jgi:hypothetical protein
MSSQWISSSGAKWFDCVGRKLELGHSELELAAARFAGTRARLEIVDLNGQAGAICPLLAFPSD